MKKVFSAAFLISLIAILLSFSSVAIADSSTASNSNATNTPGITTTNTGVFMVGQETYTYNGVSHSMDVTPAIIDNRIFLPVRYLAYAMGLTPDDVIWDGSDSTALIQGVQDGQQTIVALGVGSMTLTSMQIPQFTPNSNNAASSKTTQMDAAPEIINGRVYLPAYWVVQAFSGIAAWDTESQTVTIASDIASPYATWTSVTPTGGAYTASLPGPSAPVANSSPVDQNPNDGTANVEESLCGDVLYMVGYEAFASPVTDQDLMNFIDNGNNGGTVTSTQSVTLSGLPAQEFQVDGVNGNADITGCACYSGSTLWFLQVQQFIGEPIPSSALKFFDSFHVASSPNGQTTFEMPAD